MSSISNDWNMSIIVYNKSIWWSPHDFVATTWNYANHINVRVKLLLLLLNALCVKCVKCHEWAASTGLHLTMLSVNRKKQTSLAIIISNLAYIWVCSPWGATDKRKNRIIGRSIRWAARWRAAAKLPYHKSVEVSNFFRLFLSLPSIIP